MNKAEEEYRKARQRVIALEKQLEDAREQAAAAWQKVLCDSVKQGGK